MPLEIHLPSVTSAALLIMASHTYLYPHESGYIQAVNGGVSILAVFLELK